MSDEAWQRVQREAAQIGALARWLHIVPTRDDNGEIRVHVNLVGGFDAHPDDLAGSIVREIHRRMTEFEARLE